MPADRDDLPTTIRPGSRDERPYREGKAAAERGEGWTSNPHPVGSRAWFAHEEGRSDAR